MPADLRKNLALLEALPPFDPEDHTLSASWNALFDYFARGAKRWYREGVAIDPASRAEVAEVWKRRPDLRSTLEGLVLWYPCPEFKRAFLRAAKSGCSGDYGEWFELFPDLKAHLRSFILDRAGKFNQSFTSIYACSIWARFYDGGDAAFRQAANVIHREDRRQAKRREPSDLLRHDLESHGTLWPEEAAQINRFLVELGAEPLRHWR